MSLEGKSMKGCRSVDTAISGVYLREELQKSLKLNTGLLIPPFPECILREVTLTCVTCELEPLNYYNCNPGTYELHMLLELCITYMKA